MATARQANGTEAVGSETARHVLKVAARLFAERGYDATSVREVVEAAGVTKPTLYYHFGSKEGLAQALLTVPLTGLLDDLGAIVDAEGDPLRRLARFVDAHFAFCRDEPDRSRFLYGLVFGPVAPGLTEEIAGHADRMDEVLDRAVAMLVAEGLVPKAKASRCTTALRGMITIHTLKYLYRGANLGPGLGRRLVTDLLDGYGAHRPEESRRP